MNTDDPKYMSARKKVQDERGFFMHVSIYIVVNIFLFALNAMTSPGVYWFQWTTFGWGIGLTTHGMIVFIINKWFGEDWEEQRIKKMMDQEKKSTT